MLLFCLKVGGYKYQFPLKLVILLSSNMNHAIELAQLGIARYLLSFSYLVVIKMCRTSHESVRALQCQIVKKLHNFLLIYTNALRFVDALSPYLIVQVTNYAWFEIPQCANSARALTSVTAHPLRKGVNSRPSRGQKSIRLNKFHEGKYH